MTMLKIEKNNNVKTNVIFAVIMLIILGVVLYWGADGNKFDIHIPISYTGGDDASYASEIKMMLDGNSWLIGDKIGAPYGTDRSAEASYYLFDDVHIISYILVHITKNIPLTYNLTFLFIIVLNALSSYCVMVNRKLNGMIACAGSVIYGLLPFPFMRKGHFMLEAIYCVPIAIMIALWIYEDDSYLKLGKNFGKNMRNIFAVVASLLFVLNGIGYYAFFSCMIIMLAGISKSLKKKKMIGCWQAIKQIVLVAIMYVIILSRYIWKCISLGKFSVGGERSMLDIETFALRIARLFVCNAGTGIKFIDDKISKYFDVMVYPYEMTEYMGLFAIVGFFALLVVLLKKENGELTLLSEINVLVLIYGTLGGLSVFVFMFLTNAVRCTSRLSVYIAYISIYSLCVLFNKKIRLLNKRRYFTGVVFGLLTIISILDQLRLISLDNSMYKESYISDHEIVSELEDALPDGAMVFQLPYNEYPYSGYVNNMQPDQLFNAYINSKELKWSYGARVGEKADIWCREVSELETPEMIEKLQKKGFQAIYVDKRGYQVEDFEKLESEIRNILKQDPMISIDGNIICFLL